MDGAWSFQPDWLVGSQTPGRGDRGEVLGELSTCPSWLALDATRQNSSSLSLTAIMRRASADSRTRNGGIHDKEALSAEELCIHNLKIEVANYRSEIYQREAHFRHISAQNLAFRSETASLKKVVCDLNNELKDMRQHIECLRHISTPTTDAGALDASLAMLRGHELEQARAREKETRIALCTSESAREQLQIDLENEKHERAACETGYLNEIEKLNLEIARFTQLHRSRESFAQTTDQRHHIKFSQLEENLKELSEKHNEDIEQLKRKEERRFEELVKMKNEEIHTLKKEIDSLNRSLEKLGGKLRENEQELELAWNRADGMYREEEDPGYYEKCLAEQEQSLRSEFEKERMSLRREIAELRQLSDKPRTVVATKEQGVGTDDDGNRDQLLERLHAYRSQLHRATEQLQEMSKDSRLAYGKFLASDCARVALTKLQNKPPAVEKLETLAEMWEQQATELETLLLQREAQVSFSQAALFAARKTIDELETNIEGIKTRLHLEKAALRDRYRSKLQQAGEALQRSSKQLREQERRMAELRGENEDLARKKSVFEADLAIFENEVMRLKTELARRKARASHQTTEVATQTLSESDLLVHERAKWEAQKKREMREIQNKFVASFKRKLAKVVGSEDGADKIRLSSDSLELSLVSLEEPDVREAGGDLFNIQDCTPPVNFQEQLEPPQAPRDWKQISIPKDLPKIPRSLVSSSLNSRKRWDPEESYARWKQQQQRKHKPAATPPRSENRPLSLQNTAANTNSSIKKKKRTLRDPTTSSRAKVTPARSRNTMSSKSFVP